jgi:hypothetical protein
MIFNFPLRVNDLKVNGCMNSLKTIIYGDAYYHERLRMVVCKVTTTPIPAQFAPGAATLLLTEFYSPWYLLASIEQKLKAIVHYYSLTSS